MNIVAKIKDKVRDVFLKSQVDTKKESIQEEINERQDEFYFDDNVTQENSDFQIIPAQTLEKGWVWHQFNDGSGSLHSPNDEKYYAYDMSSNPGSIEYKESENSSWNLISKLDLDDFRIHAENVISYYQTNGVNIKNDNTDIELIKGIENQLNQSVDVDDINQKEVLIINTNILGNEQNPDSEWMEEFSPKIVPAKNLEQGWYWEQYADGSGSLHSPEKGRYFRYDLSTYIGGVEYMETTKTGWDAITNIKFDDFKKYAENVVINRYQRNDDHILVQNDELNITDDIFMKEEASHIKMPM